MTAYKPSQRRVRVEVLATAGWIHGTVHVPARNSLQATFNRSALFIPLTEATPDPSAPALGFVAVRRSAIMLVVPAEDDGERAVQPGTYERMRIRCHLADAMVEGTADVLANLRVSDFLEANPGFIVLHDATLDEGGATQRHALLLVNVSHVIAVTEAPVVEPTPPRRDPAELPEMVGV